MLRNSLIRIHPRIVAAVVRREAREVLRNRVLLAAIAVPPVILTVLPLVIGIAGGRTLPPDVVAQVVAARPDWAAMTPAQVSAAVSLQQMVVIFMLMPAYIPLAIASYSIVGEKQSRSLEAVLATPIETTDLLFGKAVAALVPGVAAVWLAFAALLGASGLVLGPLVAGIVTGPVWLASVFALGPAIGLVSVVAGVAISSRVNDPRAAQQVATVVILPIVGLFAAQTAGSGVPDSRTYLEAAAVVAAVGFVGLRAGVRLFGRETILTRWR
jgi:ABC-2 type transport system permease protein